MLVMRIQRLSASRRPARLFRFACRLLPAIATGVAVLAPHVAAAETVAVKHKEGLLHGFLVLTTPDGSHLADGDLIQTTNDNRVTSRLVFHFDDGSRYEETTEFSQDGRFRLVSDHLIERGPSFPTALDMTIDVPRGRVLVTSTDGDGKPQTTSKDMDLPDDLANGIIPVLLKNIDPQKAPKSLGFVAPQSNPQLVRLELHPSGTSRISIGESSRQAFHYVIEVDIGGFKGLVAGLVGKQPPDSHVWILGGDAPAFIGAEEPLYAEGPLWRIHIVGPGWPANQGGGSRP